ncbi:MAG: sigma-70 family RNA polymerase sigma factor [Thermoanaerobaculia bacterium]|nr:sigma-70 family RNA polymerase sigma factor [Thermoanaerobaculia bacterium]
MSVDTSAPDGALLVLAQDGESEAREELARRVRRRAYPLALQLMGNAEEARDVVQDAMLRFFRHLDRIDAGRPLEPWLYQIVRNRVRDLKRRQYVRRQESLEALRERGRPETVDPRADPAADAARHELQARVWRALAELSEPHREILVLRDYQDLSYREIAGVLKIPQGTVMSRLHAARSRLREVLVEEHRTGDRAGQEPEE